MSIRYEVTERRNNSERKLQICYDKADAFRFYERYRHNFNLVIYRISYDWHTGCIHSKSVIA